MDSICRIQFGIYLSDVYALVQGVYQRIVIILGESVGLFLVTLYSIFKVCKNVVRNFQSGGTATDTEVSFSANVSSVSIFEFLKKAFT